MTLRWGGTEAWMTSEFSVGMQLSMLVLLIYGFFVAVGAGMIIIRDGELGVGEILHGTSLSAGEYVWGRFLAVRATFLVILGLHVLCMIVIYHVLNRPSMDDMRGPFHLVNYDRPAIVFGVPTIVFIAGTSFAVGTVTRKPILVFFLPVALIIAATFFLWNWSPSWLDPGVNRLLMFLDPGGFRWLNEALPPRGLGHLRRFAKAGISAKLLQDKGFCANSARVTAMHGLQEVRLQLGFPGGGALPSCSESSAVEPDDGQMGTVGSVHG